MKTNYILEGNSDKTLVFVHGLSDSLYYWTKLTSHLSGEYQILTYDLRGHGKSELGDVKITMDVFVNDLFELLNQLNIKKIILIGLSLGGNIALSFTVKYPEMVDKLLLMSTSSEVDDNLKSKFLEFREAINIGFEEFYDVIIKYVLPEDVLTKNHDNLELNKHDSAKTANIEGIKAGIDVGINFNITNQLSKIKAETFVLSGNGDEIITVKQQKILADNIENSQMIVFDNTKHDLLIGRNISELLKLIRRIA